MTISGGDLPEEFTQRDSDLSKQIGLAIACYIDADGTISLRSVELMNANQRLRFSFTGKRDLVDILVPNAHRQIAELLDRARYTLGVLALPETILKMPRLVLENVRILVSVARDSGRHVILRFRKFFGDVFSLFQEHAIPVENPMNQVNTLVTEALDDVFMPLNNLKNYLAAKLPSASDAERRRAIEALQDAIIAIEELEPKYKAVRRYAGDPPEHLARHTPHALAKISVGD